MYYCYCCTNTQMASVLTVGHHTKTNKQTNKIKKNTDLLQYSDINVFCFVLLLFFAVVLFCFIFQNVLYCYNVCHLKKSSGIYSKSDKDDNLQAT